MRGWFGMIFLVLTLVSESVGEGRSQAAESAITSVLQEQANAWNRHDLIGFMTGYWKSPELTFFSGAHESKGWQAALERYQKSYQGTGHEMGHLEFSNLRIKMLGAEAAFVRGEFHLTMSDGKTPHGLFTLIFRKFPEGWKIVHDHSARASEARSEVKSQIEEVETPRRTGYAARPVSFSLLQFDF